MIVLTALPFVLMFIAIIAQMMGLQFLSMGIGSVLLALTSVLVQVFFILLIIIALYMAVTGIKAWIEKYLDAMLAKLDLLTERKAEEENSRAVLAAVSGKMERMDKRLEGIEKILKKVSD
ncbi:MAG: hypothetical protein GX651_03345 [Methanomicrobiales archaeon]|nr:hypothetical protein [Methanomicrobiales archaeon]